MNIAVIIPLYNAEKYIAKALESCIQLSEVKEIIVIDDGFIDNGLAIVEEYAQKHSLIKIFNHPNNENRGAGLSRNLGIEMATQEFISFLDADDYYLPNRFLKDKEIFLANPTADGCHNAMGCYFYSNLAKEQFSKTILSEITRVNPSSNPTPTNLFYGLIGSIHDYGYFHLNALTLKRASLIDSKQIFPDLKIHQDTHLIIRISLLLKIYPSNIDEPVAIRGVHEENRIIANNLNSEMDKAKKRFLLWDGLLNWAKTEKIQRRDFLKLKLKRDFFYYAIMDSKKPITLLLAILESPTLIKHPQYYTLHTSFFGRAWYSRILYKVRNIIVRLTQHRNGEIF